MGFYSEDNIENIRNVLMGTNRQSRRCPVCRKTYMPELKRLDDRAIQEQYPNEPKWKREQLISGICSDQCWRAGLSIGGVPNFDSKKNTKGKKFKN